MLIIPTIYIKHGQCVALENHQIKHTSMYSDDVADTVGRWFDKGVKRLHLIDLDGALEGCAVNADLICQIAFRFPNFSMQVSGGIRSLTEIETYVKAGVDYIVLGTKAIEDPEFAVKASALFPGNIMVAIDALDGKVLCDGREKKTDLNALHCASQLDQPSIAGLIYSDKSSSSQGINLDAISVMADTLGIPVMASLGVEDMDDIRALYAEAHKGISGVISERALREGHLDVLAAQQYCDEFED